MSKPATTLGQFIATALIAAKQNGKHYNKATLGTEIDRLHSQWTKQVDSIDDCPATRIPPTPAAVTAYSAKIGYPLDGQEFTDAYEQKGWLVGKAKMKNWQATVRNWKSNGWGKTLKPVTAGKPRDYSKI